jgi:hypothetical protein
MPYGRIHDPSSEKKHNTVFRRSRACASVLYIIKIYINDQKKWIHKTVYLWHGRRKARMRSPTGDNEEYYIAIPK